MKKAFGILILLVLHIFPGFGEEDYFFYETFAQYPTAGLMLLCKNGMANLFAYCKEDKDYYWEEFMKKDVEYREDGYARVRLFDQELLIILGGNHLMVHFPKDSSLSMYNPIEGIDGDSTGWKKMDYGVEEVSASSVLTEEIRGEKITYSPDNLIGLFLLDTGLGIGCYWNHHSLAWVEGEEGPGIGSRLDIRFNKWTDHMLVLNGFVDLGRKHLYKMNSRPKKVAIRSLEPEVSFEVEYTFEDVVRFHYIPFPWEAARVELEILSVYPGTRWQDTSISGILTNIDHNEYERLKNLKKRFDPYSERREE